MEVIIGKTAGFCYGVKRAIDGVNEEIKKSKNKVFCLGEIVHNKQVIEELELKGVSFIEDIQYARDNVIIRAHGVDREIYNIADRNNIKLIDFTCPNVLKIHEIAEEYAEKEFYIFLCGNIKHPENIGTMSYCGNSYFVIENEEMVLKALEEFKKSKLKKLLLISQTTFSVNGFNKIKNVIDNNIQEDIEFIVKNTICRATELRQKETEKISKEVEFMIIIGGSNSSNTKKLYEIARNNCNQCIYIDVADELNINEIKSLKKIGIMAGASTPQNSIDELVYRLKQI